MALTLTFYDDPRGYSLRKWPNKQTGLVAGLIYVNGVTGFAAHFLQESFIKQGLEVGNTIANASLFSAVALNVPLRAIAVRENLKKKNYFNVAMHIASFSLLLFPYGRVLSLSIDCASELYAIYVDVVLGNKRSLLSSRLDPTKIENAYKILNIPEDKRTDALHIIRRYADLMEVYIEKRPKFECLITDEFHIRWQDVNDAYSTIKEELNIN